jgi:hypothetical protein
VTLKLEEDIHCLRHISRDIESVVVARFDGFALRCIQDPALRQELLEIIRPREDRTYLYVKLLFDYLELRMRDGVPRVPRGWIDIFRKLPGTVKEAYVGFLNRVREAQRDDVRVLFQIVLAAARPLTLQEVNIALNIRDLPNGSKHGLGLQGESCFRSWILDACKYFLDVYNGRVYFIHQTAKDFLLAGPGENGHRKPEWLGEFTMETCHRTLAESCILYFSLPLRVPSQFKGTDSSMDDALEHHLWDDTELSFASYTHLFWRDHVDKALKDKQPGNQQGLLGLVKRLQPWYQKMVTSLCLSLPWSADHRTMLEKTLTPRGRRAPWDTDRLDVQPWEGQHLTIAHNSEQHIAIVDRDGRRLPRTPRLPIERPDCLDKLASVVRSLAAFHAVRSLTAYRPYSPLPADWFSVRFFNKTSRAHMASSDELQLHDGDVISYVLSNRTNHHPTYVHMLSLNASWTVGTLLWNVRIPPRQQRTGNLTMVLPRRINDDDPVEAEDTLLVIFCVGEQCAERLMSSAEWLRSVYIPPVLLEPDAQSSEVPIWPFFVPPPNWVVHQVTMRTVPRPESGSGEWVVGPEGG